MPKLSPEENYYALAAVGPKNGEVNDVPIRLYLPDRSAGRPQILLEPSVEQYERLARTFEASLNARIDNFDGTPSVEIESAKVHFLQATRRAVSPRLSECRIQAEARDLRITQHFSTTSTEEDTSSNVSFWLSPNKMLSPDVIMTSSFDGSVEVQRVREVRVDLRPGLTVHFDKHYRQNDENGEVKRWTIDVATCSLKCRAVDTRGIKGDVLALLDDLLLVASLATRTRTACVGWVAADRLSVTRFYRGDISIPTGYALPSFDQGLLDLLHLAEFLQTAMDAVRVRTQPQPIRSAIYVVVPSGPRTLEEDFVSLFHALEEIVLDFRRRVSFEHILNDTDWAALQSHLKDTIKKWNSGSIPKAERALIYEKLSELNRVPFRRAFEAYCANLGVDLSDLWPVFDTVKNPGLYDVRNKLVHGEAMLPAHHDVLWVATAHLRWTLERILLAELGWPIASSEVKPELLRQNAIAMQTLSDARSNFSHTN